MDSLCQRFGSEPSGSDIPPLTIDWRTDVVNALLLDAREAQTLKSESS
jgi:hypothetical protein